MFMNKDNDSVSMYNDDINDDQSATASSVTEVDPVT